MLITRRIHNYFELAKNVANQGVCVPHHHVSHHHGAVLVQGNRIINTGFNDYRYCSFATRFLVPGRDKDGATRHAEISAILNISRKLTYGADIYVVRVNNFGELKLSKPCEMCFSCCEFCGIKRIFYSIDDNHCGMVKVL